VRGSPCMPLCKFISEATANTTNAASTTPPKPRHSPSRGRGLH
jgi:hypothetical protein